MYRARSSVRHMRQVVGHKVLREHRSTPRYGDTRTVNPRDEIPMLHSPVEHRLPRHFDALERLELPNSLPTVYQEMIFKTHYARIVKDRNHGGERREHWSEAVRRAVTALTDTYAVNDAVRVKLAKALANLQVMPSMRVVMTAGPALDRDNMCSYNCTYLEVDSINALSEVMYLLSCGTGVGFSCERSAIAPIPALPREIRPRDETLVVPDSGAGWALAFREYLHELWSGFAPRVDYSKIRPAGARLHTMGGRASGPEPFKDVIDFSHQIAMGARGRKLKPIEVHELVCKVARSIAAVFVVAL